MKKSIVTLFFSAFFNVCMAQSVTTYSVYDTNQSGDLTVSDVTNVVDKVKSNVAVTSTQQYVTAEDLSSILKDIQDDLKLIKEKLGIKNPETPDERVVTKFVTILNNL